MILFPTIFAPMLLVTLGVTSITSQPASEISVSKAMSDLTASTTKEEYLKRLLVVSEGVSKLKSSARSQLVVNESLERLLNDGRRLDHEVDWTILAYRDLDVDGTVIINAVTSRLQSGKASDIPLLCAIVRNTNALEVTVDVNGCGSFAHVNFGLFPNAEAIETIPRILLEAMFEKNPEATLLQLSASYVDRAQSAQLLQYERQLTDRLWFQAVGVTPRSEELNESTIKAIEFMAHHELWWVRRYLVEILKRSASLRIAKLLENLVSDSDPFVRKIAVSIRERHPGD